LSFLWALIVLCSSHAGASMQSVNAVLIATHDHPVDSATQAIIDRASANAERVVRTERRLRNVAIASTLLMGAILLALYRRHRTATQLHQALTRAHEQLKARSAELYHASVTDALTGLKNRRFIMTELENCLNPRKQSLAIAMIDLDHFKSINDQYGHNAGDVVLSRVAQMIQAELPPDVQVARIGGEEFLLLISDRTESEARELLDRIRVSVQSTSIALDSGQIFVSVSFGYCYLSRDQNASMTKLLSSADDALYRAKGKGRNRIESAEVSLAER
jgi:diguanylate cyclase (GGDEF)-like protein